jgi:hypothetical protein
LPVIRLHRPVERKGLETTLLGVHDLDGEEATGPPLEPAPHRIQARLMRPEVAELEAVVHAGRDADPILLAPRLEREGAHVVSAALDVDDQAGQLIGLAVSASAARDRGGDDEEPDDGERPANVWCHESAAANGEDTARRNSLRGSSAGTCGEWPFRAALLASDPGYNRTVG